jgi:uncharacterized membrane protein YfcA
VETAGYILTLCIGLSLGLVGSGGSILAVPLLLYFFGLDAVTATAYSLFIVGTSAATGASRFLIRGEVELKTALSFAAASLLSVYAVRRFLIPNLPEYILQTEMLSITRDSFITLFFAGVMLLAGTRMIRKQKLQPLEANANIPYLRFILHGVLVGALAGFVGAGGGFLIIPALVLLIGLPMKKAVATSLLIIAIQSLLGFLGDVQTRTIDWHLLLSLGAIASAGIFIGMWLGTRVDGSKLKNGFGWFIIGMALFMLIKEGIFT